MPASIYISTSSTRGFFFSKPSAALVVCGFLMIIPIGVRWYLIVVLFAFSNNEWCWAFFHVFISHLCVFLTQMSVQVFCSLFDWVALFFFWYWVVWAAWIFWKLTLCQLFNLLLFSPILRVVFHLVYSSFSVQKLLTLIRTHLFILVFISIILGGGS